MLDLLRYPLIAYDHCVGCNRAITSEPYYGLLGVEQDDLVYFDAGHPRCLAEWGLEIDGGAIFHYHVEPNG